MRSLNSFKNTIVSIIMSIISVVVTFISQKVVMSILGQEYLGLNGLFSNIISMLAIAELGFGSASIYSMYEPIAKNDTEQIKSLMKFYQSVYRIIAVAISVLGICLIPFLGFIVGESNISVNITLVYCLFVFDAVASYLLSYKRAILYASQQAYLINIVHIFYLIFMNAAQILVLILTKNYILFLVIKLIFRILENIIITLIANKKYPYIIDRNVTPIAEDTKNSIWKKIKGLVLHKIGATGVSATDNIIVTYFLSIAQTGLLSSYVTLTSGLSMLISQVFDTLTSSVGNLLLENDTEKSYTVYKSLYLFNFWIYSFAAIGLVALTEPVITVWIGEQYLLSFATLVVLCINFYFVGMKKVFTVFKEAAGIFYEDRFTTIIEAVINIAISIILVQFLGMPGVFLGTIISALVQYLYTYPVLVYKKLFHKEYGSYLIQQVKFLILFLLTFVITIYCISLVSITNIWTKMLIRLIIVMVIPNTVYFIIFRKSESFQYYFALLKVVKENIFKKKQAS